MQVALNLDLTTVGVLGRILHEHEDRCRALGSLTHATEVERQLFGLEMAVCQTVYLQLEGAKHVPANGAPDWSEDFVAVTEPRGRTDV